MYGFLDYQVRDVMSAPVVIVPGATLAEALGILEGRGFNALPVVDEEARLVGLVTTLDVLRAFAFTGDSTLPPYDRIMRRPVQTVMSAEPLAMRPRTPLTRVLERMLLTRNRSFPVVEDGRLVGMVSRRDVMAALRRAESA